MEILTMDKVLAANDAWAFENRNYLREQNIVMLNLIGSPGAGKTTLLEKTIEMLSGQLRIGVVEGDIATARDAQRIKEKGVPVYQINTGTACHLDAHLVFAATKILCRQGPFDCVFVENIGNLVCPAEFDIGEAAKVAVLSVTEGDDKVEKYPLLFSEAEILVVTKTAFLGKTNFNLEHVRNVFTGLNPFGKIVCVDSLSGEGFEAWIDFVVERVTEKIVF